METDILSKFLPRNSRRIFTYVIVLSWVNETCGRRVITKQLDKCCRVGFKHWPVMLPLNTSRWIPYEGGKHVLPHPGNLPRLGADAAICERSYLFNSPYQKRNIGYLTC